MLSYRNLPSVRMAARVRWTCRITGLERTKSETGGLAVGSTLAVASTVATSETSRRCETSRTAITTVMLGLLLVMVLWLMMVLGPMVVLMFVFVLLLFMMRVVMVVLGLVWFFVTTEDAEERTGWPDRPNHCGVDLHSSIYGQCRFVGGLSHHLGRHELSVFGWNARISIIY